MRSVWDFVSFPLSYPARHPLFWLVLSPGIAFMGASAGSQSIPLVFFAVLATLTYPAAFIIFALNDLYDAKPDEHIERDLVKDDAIDPSEDAEAVWGWAAVFTAVCSAPVLWYGKPSTILLGAGLVVAAYAYSVPPLRLKANPLLSVILMGVGGWMLYAFGYSFTDALRTIPTRSFYYGLLSHMAVSLGAIPDMEADRKAGDTTFPLLYGESATIGLALLSVIVTLLSGTVGGPVFWYLVIFGGGLVSMWVFEHYVLHFKVLLGTGFVFLAVLLVRAVSALV